MKGRITIFSITGCPFCIRAKNKISELNLKYVDINLDSHPDRRSEIQERTGRKTVPQIFFNAKHVGSFDDLEALNDSELDELIREVAENEAPDTAPAPPQELPDEEESWKQAIDSGLKVGVIFVDFKKAFDTVNHSILKSKLIAAGVPGGYGSSGFTCEQDEYAELVKQIKDSGIVKDHYSFLRTYKNTFRGKEAVDWLVQTKQVDRGQAVAMGNSLLEKHFVHSAKKETMEFRDDDTLYRLLEDDDSNALNADVSSDCEPRPAAEVGESLRKIILQLYAKHLSRDGKGVDYKAMKSSKEFESYVKHTAELKRVKLEETPREEKLSFFINVYNALVIHANVVNGPPVNLWQRYKFFNVVSYIIGGYMYSLHDIESGILRANRRPVASFFRPFSKTDPRLLVALPEPEPMIHFALVCGAKSCPPIKTYTPDGIDEQLKLAGEAFLEGDDGCQIDMCKQEVKLSMIFKWYKEDFGEDKAEIVQWAYDHIGDSEKKKNLAELLTPANFKLSHVPYNWNLNSK